MNTMNKMPGMSGEAGLEVGNRHASKTTSDTDKSCEQRTQIEWWHHDQEG
jgi:hypothetical protein